MNDNGKIYCTEDTMKKVVDEGAKMINANFVSNEQYNRLQSELDAYKIALGYFIKEGGKPAADIAENLLKEVKK